MNLEKKSKEFRTKVFNEMIFSRGDKYKWFLRGLKSFKYLSGSFLRGELLESSYSYFRYIDDIVDGDISLPKSFSSSVDFVEDKINFLNNLSKPKDDLDFNFLYLLEVSDKLGFGFEDEIRDILHSLYFDANRYGKREFFSQSVLDKHFNLLDIRGTVKAALKAFARNYDDWEFLEPLGLASRIYYNLRDYQEDLDSGFFNVSLEDCEKFGINLTNIENLHSKEVQSWFYDQSKKGRDLLGKHKHNLSQSDFGNLANLAFRYVYERPAKRYFEKVLSSKV